MLRSVMRDKYRNMCRSKICNDRCPGGVKGKKGKKNEKAVRNVEKHVAVERLDLWIAWSSGRSLTSLLVLFTSLRRRMLTTLTTDSSTGSCHSTSNGMSEIKSLTTSVQVNQCVGGEMGVSKLILNVGMG